MTSEVKRGRRRGRFLTCRVMDFGPEQRDLAPNLRARGPRSSKPDWRDTMLDAQALADRYVAAWNEPDAARRSSAIAALWAPDAPGHEGTCGSARSGGSTPQPPEGNAAREGVRFRAAPSARPRRRPDVPLGDAACRQRDCAGERATVSHCRRRRADPGRPSIRACMTPAPFQPAFTSRRTTMPFIAAKTERSSFGGAGEGAPMLFLNSMGLGSQCGTTR